MNYHAYSYDIAYFEHGARTRTGQLRGARTGVRDRYRRRTRSSADASFNPTGRG
jgi:hypothetical protein